MRVLMLAPVLPMLPDDDVGASVSRLAEGLVERGHSVRILAPGEHGIADTALLGKVEVRRLRYAAANAKIRDHTEALYAAARRSPRAALTVAKLVRDAARAIGEESGAGAYHIIHAHGWLPAGLAAAVADRHGRPLVITLHHTDMRLARRIPGAAMVLGAALRRAKLVTAAASYLAEEAARTTGLTRGAIPITPMPLTPRLDAEPAPGIPSGVVYVGRLAKHEGVNYLLEAMALLKKQGLPLDLTVVGDGPERVALKAQALALAVPTVFTGFVPPDQFADYIGGKRVFVLPSVQEEPGLIVVEALCLGVPVVATHTGGVPDLLTEEGAGVLVDPADPTALAAAIRRVASDDSFLTGAVNAGRVLMARRTPAASAAAFDQAYDTARGRRTRGGLPLRFGSA